MKDTYPYSRIPGPKAPWRVDAGEPNTEKGRVETHPRETP